MKRIILLILFVLISSVSFAEYDDRYRYVKEQVSKKDNSIVLLLGGSIAALYGYTWEKPIEEAKRRNNHAGTEAGIRIRDELYSLSILCFGYYGYLKFGIPYFRVYQTYDRTGIEILTRF